MCYDKLISAVNFPGDLRKNQQYIKLEQESENHYKNFISQLILYNIAVLENNDARSLSKWLSYHDCFHP